MGNLTEVGSLWQVPLNETVDVLIRASLPRCIRMGKIAVDDELDRALLAFGILGPVVQREGLTISSRNLSTLSDVVLNDFVS
jgi:hypothetical protein